MRAARAAAATADPATRQQLLAATLDAQGEHVCSFDEKSDIWTIGILGFELYFKFPPFGSQVRKRRRTRSEGCDMLSMRLLLWIS